MVEVIGVALHWLSRDPKRWRRADLGDLPEPGREIAMVIWSPEPDGVSVWRRMRVEVVMRNHPYGPGLPPRVEDDFEVPARPADRQFGARATLWRYIE